MIDTGAAPSGDRQISRSPAAPEREERQFVQLSLITTALSVVFNSCSTSSD